MTLFRLSILENLFIPIRFSCKHMVLKDCSLPVKMLPPSGVREQTFLGRSFFRFHWRLMQPFSSRSLRKGQIVLGPKYIPKFLRMLVMILYPCIGSDLKKPRTTRSRTPLVSCLSIFFISCEFNFLFLFQVYSYCCFVLRLYNMSLFRHIISCNVSYFT